MTPTFFLCFFVFAFFVFVFRSESHHTQVRFCCAAVRGMDGLAPEMMASGLSVILAQRYTSSRRYAADLRLLGWRSG